MYEQKVRIISGRWRGRKLTFPLQPNLRPTSDRIRGTLFNWLNADIPQSHCLDLFAGSGVLGIEALSRGAQRVTAVDNDTLVIKQLQLTKEKLGIDEHYSIVHSCGLKYLGQYSGPPYDLIFLDPPFADNCIAEILQNLQSLTLLKANGLVYVEGPKASTTFSSLSGWQFWRQKNAGNVAYGLLERS